MFTFWKSPYAGGFIEWFNSFDILYIDRTIDYADLIALTVLPGAWIYSEKCESIRLPVFSQKYALAAIALISVFAFTATSQAKPEYRYLEYQENYEIRKTPLEVLKRLQEYETDYFNESRGQTKNVTTVSVMFREKFCDDKPSAGFEVSGGNGISAVRLTSISYNCQTMNLENQEKLKRIFEAEVIEFLKN